MVVLYNFTNMIMLILTVIFYCLTLILIIWQIKNNNISCKYVQTLTLTTLVLHGIIVLNLYQNQVFLLGFVDSLLSVSLITGILFFLISYYYKTIILGIFIYPLAIISICLKLFLPDNNIIMNGNIIIHIILSITSYSLLLIALFQSILLKIQSTHLHKKDVNKFIYQFPPLQTMENLLFTSIIFGFIFLTLSLVSGVIFLDDIFAQHLLHKTTLSIMSWIIFAVLIFGRLRFGWRGKAAINASQVAFVLLFLAYFGSKFVIELLIN